MNFGKEEKPIQLDSKREHINLIYVPSKVDENGIVTFDFKGILNPMQSPASKTIKYTEFQPFRSGVSVSDKSFYVINKNEFANLKANKILTEYEKSCPSVQQSRMMNFYQFYGYAVKAFVGNDIAPSITYMISNLPNKVVYKNKADLQKHIKDETTQILKTCNSNTGQLFYSINSRGIASSECFPNNVIPTDTSKCKDGSSPNSYLVGYREGTFLASYDIVKELLIRFGPVYTGRGIILGWEQYNGKETFVVAVNNPVTDQQTLENQQFEVSMPYGGKVLFNEANIRSNSGQDL
ncbi:MAG: hypothetical protein EZS28_035185 [Streblomastix strix]|uniref:Uncharacterized protein n=1 Tax=Streblomastix strix TaxID=222440 RepID=A0A5J4UF91_9EUKA|nr:MAG: hypothetical protein EZS28_035185 [Streblomastix strix]